MYKEERRKGGSSAGHSLPWLGPRSLGLAASAESCLPGWAMLATVCRSSACEGECAARLDRAGACACVRVCVCARACARVLVRVHSCACTRVVCSRACACLCVCSRVRACLCVCSRVRVRVAAGARLAEGGCDAAADLVHQARRRRRPRRVVAAPRDRRAPRRGCGDLCRGEGGGRRCLRATAC